MVVGVAVSKRVYWISICTLTRVGAVMPNSYHYEREVLHETVRDSAFSERLISK